MPPHTPPIIRFFVLRVNRLPSICSLLTLLILNLSDWHSVFSNSSVPCQPSGAWQTTVSREFLCQYSIPAAQVHRPTLDLTRAAGRS